MRFEHPLYLWFLIAVPLFMALWFYLRRKSQQQLSHFADPEMHHRLVPDSSRRRPLLKMILISLALALIIVAWANPLEGSKKVKGERAGSDIAICLDISNSMMAEDLSPNRLERCKHLIGNLTNELAGDRISLIIFAGESFISMPLTNDYSAARMFIDQVDCEMISTQGTNISGAIDKAMQTFGYGDPDREYEKTHNRAIIIISDGESFEGDAVESAKDAYEEGVITCTMGVGKSEGAPIPLYQGGRSIGYKKDNDGNVVTTRLDEETLKQIAYAGHGCYLRASNINTSLKSVLDQLDNLDKNTYDEQMFSSYESRYYIPLALALALLLIEVTFFERRNPKINLSKILKVK